MTQVLSHRATNTARRIMRVANGPAETALVALHEAGHLAAALAHGIAPLTEIERHPGGLISGRVIYGGSPLYRQLQPRHRAMLAIMGSVATAAIAGPCGEPSTLNHHDLAGVTREGMTLENIVRDARAFVEKHRDAIERLAGILCKAERLEAADVLSLLQTDPVLSGLREAAEKTLDEVACA